MSEQVENAALTRIDQARQWLAEAKSLTEIKAVRDMAEAARLYARAAGLGEQAMNAAAEVKLRAERKAGEVLGEMEKHPPGPVKGIADSMSAIPLPPKLEDIGISHKQSSRWQAEASVPARGSRGRV